MFREYASPFDTSELSLEQTLTVLSRTKKSSRIISPHFGIATLSIIIPLALSCLALVTAQCPRSKGMGERTPWVASEIGRER
jgi:hypothetical protein